MTASTPSLPELLLPLLDAGADAPCQRWDAGGPIRAQRTCAALARDVRALARALLALGLQVGDRVGIVSENRPRWLTADLAIMTAGCVGVPRGGQSPVGEVAAILEHAECRVVFVEDAATWARFREVLNGCEHVVLLEGEAPDDGLLTFDDLLGLGGQDEALPRLSDTAVATLVYTSGTTGRPKGVTLTHRNIVSNVLSLSAVLRIERGHRFLALLPSWHMYERTVEYYALMRGAEISYTDPRRLKDDLVAERPHFLASVPRVWESLHDRVVGGVGALPGPVRWMAQTALRGSLRYRKARNTLSRRTAETAGRASPPRQVAGAAAGMLFWPLHALAGRLVHRRLRAATGGRLQAAISGGGALPAHVDAFFDATGIPVLIGYGLTETSPVVAVRRPERNVLGTIGTPIADTELQLRPVGEVTAGGVATDVGRLFVRGPQVMQGYWHDPEATAAVLSDDGWFDTGDLVRLTGAGDLVFCGRAKDTIVLRGGENSEPEPLEQAARASPVIEQIVVFGQDRKALGALVWPSNEEVERRLGPNPASEATLGLIRAELRERVGPNGGFQAWERVPHVGLMPAAMTVENGLSTATLKVKRSVVGERWHTDVEALFDRR